MESRYDGYAQWYAEFTRDWSPSCLPYLPPGLDGQGVLDLACGVGTLSALIAERGATVTAVALSSTMLDRAPPVEGVDCRQGDATTTDWWDGEAFDGVVSNMALMDIEDLDAALATIATVTSPHGWVLTSVLHPCPAEPTLERCRAGRPNTATRGTPGSPPATNIPSRNTTR